MDKLKRRFEIEDDSFMQWLQRKAVGTTTAAGLFAQPAEVPPPPEPVGVPRRRRNSDGAVVSHQKLQLSHDDKDMLISLLDKGLPRDVAYRAINALPDSEKFLLAESFIQGLRRQNRHRLRRPCSLKTRHNLCQCSATLGVKPSSSHRAESIHSL